MDIGTTPLTSVRRLEILYSPHRLQISGIKLADGAVEPINVNAKIFGDSAMIGEVTVFGGESIDGIEDLSQEDDS